MEPAADTTGRIKKKAAMSEFAQKRAVRRVDVGVGRIERVPETDRCLVCCLHASKTFLIRDILHLRRGSVVPAESTLGNMQNAKCKMQIRDDKNGWMLRYFFIGKACQHVRLFSNTLKDRT
jgi:hypothetical protein